MKSYYALIAVAALAVGCASQSDTSQASPSDATSVASQPATPPADDKTATTGLVDFKNEQGELICPVSGDVIASADKAVGHEDYNGKRYYFCCAACPPLFKDNPDKFADGKAIKSGEAKPMH